MKKGEEPPSIQKDDARAAVAEYKTRRKSSLSQDAKLEPSPITVGDVSKAAYAKHEQDERDKGGHFAHPFSAHEIFEPHSTQRRNDPKFQPRYDPIGYPEVGHVGGPGGGPRGAVARDPLNFGGDPRPTGFTNDPRSIGAEFANPERLIGPDGVQDHLRDYSIQQQILMGHLPQDRGMPSPVLPNVPRTDIRQRPGGFGPPGPSRYFN